MHTAAMEAATALFANAANGPRAPPPPAPTQGGSPSGGNGGKESKPKQKKGTGGGSSSSSGRTPSQPAAPWFAWPPSVNPWEVLALT